MSTRSSRLLALLGVTALLTVALSGCETTTQTQPQQNWDGLERKEVKGLDAVYLLPNAKVKAYNTVMLDPVEVAFDKNWDPNRSTRDVSRMFSSKDIEKIRTEMADEFRKQFEKELAEGNYKLVTAPEADTLRVSAGLANVYITAPDKMSPGRSYTLTNESGRMTLVMELRDGMTNQLLGRVVDQKVGDNFGRMQVTDSVTNSADFRAAVTAWTKRLVQGLDKLRAGETPGA